MNSVFLSGERIHLRALAPSDAEGAYPLWLNDELVCSGNSHHRFAYTKSQALQYIEKVSASQSELVLAIVLNDSKKHVGNISLQKINWINRTAEFAILIGEKEVWGKGIGLEAGRLIIRHGFESLNLNRIDCATLSTNQGMKKLAEALGMSAEGLRKQAVFKSGEYLDVVEFGLLKSDWSDGK